MRTVANGNNDEIGSTNDLDPKFTGSIDIEGDQGSTKVSTIEKGKGQTHLPTIVSWIGNTLFVFFV